MLHVLRKCSESGELDLPLNELLISTGRGGFMAPAHVFHSRNKWLLFFLWISNTNLKWWFINSFHFSKLQCIVEVWITVWTGQWVASKNHLNFFSSNFLIFISMLLHFFALHFDIRLACGVERPTAKWLFVGMLNFHPDLESIQSRSRSIDSLDRQGGQAESRFSGCPDM